ncbi:MULTISPECIES: SHOCT domain-containing protein [unclassified Microbacterium]|uniref:SHOCT domain-containing protein n=1 Tax=unclassified Microbacterium TaxID=2609290 RepID=UPI001981CF8A|nr:SHOCT domain-containing protein [Microbacterium sp. K35]MBN6192094.1 SHOCT domain-containing protein [Aneurinibacillus sp. BA2021]
MGLFDKVKDAASQAAQAGMDKARAAVPGVSPAASVAPAETVMTVAAEPRPIIELESHIDGRNAKVRLWADRLEWERPRGVSGGKITAGVLTGGVSLLATGVKGGKDEHDMVLLKHVTNVTSRKDGLKYYAVDVQTSAGAAVNTITFRVSRDEAAQFRSVILGAMQEQEAKASAPVVVQAPMSAAPAPAAAAPDLTAQLQQLAALRDAGVLTEEEFAAKKADILARI